VALRSEAAAAGTGMIRIARDDGAVMTWVTPEGDRAAAR
jgi:hypothetical protein